MPSIINATTTNGVAISPDNSGSLQLATNNGTTAVTINTSQNVGIGTTSPSNKLSVVTASGSDGFISVSSPTTETAGVSVNGGTSSNKGAIVRFQKDASTKWTMGTDSAIIGGTSDNFHLYSGGANAVLFSTNATERMRITSGGLVGIGTSSPWSSISLNTPAAATDGYLGIKDPTYGGDIRFGKGSGINNDAIAGVWSNNNFLFYTNSTERMRINTVGALLLGTTATSPATADTYGVTINSNTNGSFYAGVIQASANGSSALLLNRGSDDGSTAAFRRSGTQVGGITVTTSSTSYNTSSDYRLKENIAPMTGALEKVSQLKPCTYIWKSNGKVGEGFIAHELAEVCPDAVSGKKDAVDKDGNPEYQGVDTSFLVATLTAAIQEQQAMIEELKQEVQLLKNPPVEGTE